MNRTYILETDRATRQTLTANRERKYFQPVTQNIAVSEAGTVKVRPEVVKFAHGYNEPAQIGNLNRTKQRIRTAEALERIYETNAKLLGLIRYEEKIMQRRQANREKRAIWKAQRLAK